MCIPHSQLLQSPLSKTLGEHQLKVIWTWTQDWTATILCDCKNSTTNIFKVKTSHTQLSNQAVLNRPSLVELGGLSYIHTTQDWPNPLNYTHTHKISEDLTSVSSFLFHGAKSLVVWSKPTLMTNSPSGSHFTSSTLLKCPEITTSGVHSFYEKSSVKK